MSSEPSTAHHNSPAPALALSSSFRDPAGFVFSHKDIIYRQVNKASQADFELFTQSGLYDALVAKQLIVAHKVIKKTDQFGHDTERFTIIKPEHIPFISYPYEWSFSQLKDAALLTLQIQEIAIEHGMILKDASAYNVQFIGKRPVFIDTLSFMKYEVGKPWEGYRQFCEHFLTPLAVARFTNYDALTLLRSNLEGVPLNLACSMLPKRARFNAGLLSHLFLHNASQKRFEKSGAKSDTEAQEVKTRPISKLAMQGLMSSLGRTVRSLKPPKSQTEWGDYYDFTNYTEKGFKQKHKLVGKYLDAVSPTPQTVWDFGANNGEFSQIAAERDIYTIAWDIDPIAVGRNYLHKEYSDTMLPLIQDCVNPSPSIGWMNRERDSLFERGPADVTMVLALIHHLAIGRNLPLTNIAEFLAATSKHVIIEFVPKGDSKVDILLASRKDIFPDYTIEQFEAAMGQHFKLIEKKTIPHTKRTLFLFKHKV
jgi:ribosomal protein L11 methylase PrmA